MDLGLGKPQHHVQESFKDYALRQEYYTRKKRAISSINFGIFLIIIGSLSYFTNFRIGWLIILVGLIFVVFGIKELKNLKREFVVIHGLVYLRRHKKRFLVRRRSRRR